MDASRGPRGQERRPRLIFGNGTVAFSGIDLTTWILGGALVGVLVDRGMTGGLSRLLGDLVAGVLGALAAIALLGYFTHRASYGFGGRLAVAVLGGAIFAAAHGAQYRRPRRWPPPGTPIAAEDASANEPASEPAPADETSRTPTATV
jgi:hypothetical protein